MDIKAFSGRAAGNKECIQLLKQLLREAKKGMVSHVAVAVAAEPNMIYHESVGSIAFQQEICGALDELRDKIHNMRVARFAPFNPNLTANHVTFSVSAYVISYDFICWLIGAEMYRIRNKAPTPLKVAFYHVEQPSMNIPPIQAQMMRNVVGPMVETIGGQISPFQGGRGDFSTTYNKIVEFHKAGEHVPKLRPTAMATGAIDALLDGIPPPVVITLREANHYPNRNSNLEAWLRFANDLKRKGEQVIIVRDTAKATEEISGFATLPVVSENLHLRLALYARAKVNMFVANGPATLNFHLDTPFIMLSEIDADHLGTYEPAWPEWWPDRMGIEAGEQFPWFNEKQKIVWQPDSYENISAAWESHSL